MICSVEPCSAFLQSEIIKTVDECLVLKECPYFCCLYVISLHNNYKLELFETRHTSLEQNKRWQIKANSLNERPKKFKKWKQSKQETISLFVSLLLLMLLFLLTLDILIIKLLNISIILVLECSFLSTGSMETRTNEVILNITITLVVYKSWCCI